ncbi:MAG: LysR family transcriptional regulator [Clostridia bacterium]|nr:LysR family transcriptional regulator [Clostridia bacterium]
MDFLKLKYFQIIAKHEHVTKAAEEIHIAQPALTKTVRQLEEEFGVPLLCKKGRNIALTAYGKFLKGKLDEAFPILEALPAELEKMKLLQKNTVRLNVLAASTIVTDAVVGYKKKHPEVIFQLIQNEEETDCDITVTTGFVDAQDSPVFLKRRAFRENIYLAVPKDSKYGARERIALKEAQGEGFVSLAGSRLFRALCDRFCAYAGFKPETVFESDSPVAIKNVIGAHAGVGFWPEFSWGKTPPSNVVLLPISEPVCQRELIVGLHEGGISDSSRGFYEYLVAFMQKRQSSQK